MKERELSEEEYENDFKPLAGFYTYHVEKKNISITLKEVENNGVILETKKKVADIAPISLKMLSPNIIYFSSSEKKKNVKNLMWGIRCSAHHPENVSVVHVNDKKCYQIQCGKKDKNTGKVIPTMKGLVECDIWPLFINELTNRIIENENI